MKIPRFWAQGEAHGVTPGGAPRRLTVWRWSDSSVAEAQQLAHDAAADALERCVQTEEWPDHYPYGVGRPLREEVIDRLDGLAEPMAAVTRNSYGSLVLNVERVMFIDIDFPPSSVGASLKKLVTGWFKPTMSHEDEQEANVVQAVEAFLQSRPEWGIRLYRTAGGARAMATHATFDPTGAEARLAMEALGCDPVYIKLCHNQECFRARLTPKPWRLRMSSCAVPWPFEAGDELAHRNWVDEYDARQAAYRVCRFIGSYGRDAIHESVAPIVEIHDSNTRCHEDHLPLEPNR